MCAVDRKHEPIEEPPPLRCGAAEQPVHRGRHPDDTDMVRERRRGNRLTIDAALAWKRNIFAALGLDARSKRREAERASTSAAAAQEPSPSENATSSSVARRSPRPGARNEIASMRFV